MKMTVLGAWLRTARSEEYGEWILQVSGNVHEFAHGKQERTLRAGDLNSDW